MTRGNDSPSARDLTERAETTEPLSVKADDRTADLLGEPHHQTVPVTERTLAGARTLAGVSAAVLAVAVLSGCGDAGSAAHGESDNKPAAVNLTTPATGGTAATAPAAEATDQAPAPVGSASTRTVTETQSIAYATRTVTDSSLTKGKTVTRTAGKTGIRTLTYRVTLAGGTQVGKALVKSVVTRKPVTKVVAVGTKAATSGGGHCDPNYSGCVPIASDVDCAGGSGNGPAYVKGPVRVIGTDIYDLDRDGDGVACDT
jgi:hypothetical protein